MKDRETLIDVCLLPKAPVITCCLAFAFRRLSHTFVVFIILGQIQTRHKPVWTIIILSIEMLYRY